MADCRADGYTRSADLCRHSPEPDCTPVFSIAYFLSSLLTISECYPSLQFHLPLFCVYLFVNSELRGRATSRRRVRALVSEQLRYTISRISRAIN